jgi:hypothetical protein
MHQSVASESSPPAWNLAGLVLARSLLPSRTREGTMDGIYFKAIALLLLFPWALVALAVLGSLRRRRPSH